MTRNTWCNTGRLGCAIAVCAALSGPAVAEGDVLSFLPDYLPNVGGFAIGRVPDYIGSDEGFIGAAPALRISSGQRYVQLLANYMTVNLLEDPHWQAGPAGMLRFGRDGAEDAAVRHLPEIDNSIELGGFLAYQFHPTPDIRDSWAFGVDFLQDVTGVHDGFTLSARAQRWMPVMRYSAVGFTLATTYGSSGYLDTYFGVAPGASLPAYEPGGGMRDVRAGVVFVQPVSPKVLLGAGLFYSRLLGDVADSPIVSETGSAISCSTAWAPCSPFDS